MDQFYCQCKSCLEVIVSSSEDGLYRKQVQHALMCDGASRFLHVKDAFKPLPVDNNVSRKVYKPWK